MSEGVVEQCQRAHQEGTQSGFAIHFVLRDAGKKQLTQFVGGCNVDMSEKKYQ